MQIVSYRGPGMAGGVSTALSSVWHKHSSDIDAWWHVKESNLVTAENATRETRNAAVLKLETIDGHYRYCNEYLWPIIFDMPDRAKFEKADYDCYKKFCAQVASSIDSRQTSKHTSFFVQDYQLALVPGYLESRREHEVDSESQIFWHIPWPKVVRTCDSVRMLELACSLLHCKQIGFHTREYADNFYDFVNKNSKRIARSAPHLVSQLDTDSIERKLVIAPMGINAKQWSFLSGTESRVLNATIFNSLKDRDFVLSVDRADYTKGVFQRLKAIDAFFTSYPEWRKKITFVQICTRTREGLEAFDSYWLRCNELARKIQSKWSSHNWQPLLWIEEPLGHEDIATLYRNARLMLVTPLRDGLNLTAKEFVACQDENAGMLVLSRGAGVWSELGEHCITANPKCPLELSSSIRIALEMSEEKRMRRVKNMKSVLSGNTVNHWWSKFKTSSIRSHSETSKSGDKRILIPA